jgi:acyl carrier protein
VWRFLDEPARLKFGKFDGPANLHPEDKTAIFGRFYTQILDQYLIKRGGYISVQTMEIEQEIRTFITETFLLGSSEMLTDDTPLLGNVIDSTGVIQLIMFVQERFAISVEDEETMTDNFGSVKNVVAFIEKKLGSRG